METLEAKAAAGDPAAQYALAARLNQAGKYAEAKALNARAADAGHPGALYTIAAEELSKPPAQMDIGAALRRLERAAAGGSGAGLCQLGVLSALGLGVAAEWTGAVRHVEDAAQRNYPPALRDLAVAAIIAGADKSAPCALLRKAGLSGDWISVWLGLRMGGVFGAAEAGALIDRLKRGRAPLAESLDAAGSMDPAANSGAISPLADAVCAFDPEGDAAPLERLHQSPDILRGNGFLTALECDYMIAKSAGLLSRSRVVDSDKSGASHAQFRSSDEARFGILDLDLTLMMIYRRLANFAGMPIEHCELMGVLRYQPGQEYKPHYDFLPEDADDYSEVRRAGQRSRTVVAPLNSGFDGGETVFPRLDISFSGAAGDALVFHNVDAQGKPYRETLHAGAPVRAGEKWLMTLWVRERPFWFWV